MTTGEAAVIPEGEDDLFAEARAVADAVHYEGYVLYPYRASARKNQMRWQFGVLVPPACSASDPSERSIMRTECLVDPGDATALAVRVRCLQLQHRSIETLGDLSRLSEPLVPWDEAVEQTVDLPLQGLHPLATASRVVQFRFPSADDPELVRAPLGDLVARVVRRRELVQGRVAVSATEVEGGYVKVTVAVVNMTSWSKEDPRGRDDMLRRSLVAVHTMLAVEDGTFVSLLDPPEAARAAAATCNNDGTYPVLVSPKDDVVLSSPIILYDHPAVAPESPGDLFDATEIDEILALRILTLTDAEKAEARATDPRAAAILDRVDTMPPEMWERLHGAVRSVSLLPVARDDVSWWDPGADAEVDPSRDTVRIGDVEVGRGSRVRLRPSRRADAQDIFLADQTGTVAAVFRDVDGDDHVAVTLAADPSADLHQWQGRYLYFHPDEVEPLTDDIDPEEATA